MQIGPHLRPWRSTRLTARAPPAALSTPPPRSPDQAAFVSGVRAYSWFKSVENASTKYPQSCVPCSLVMIPYLQGTGQGAARGKTRKRRPKRTLGRLLYFMVCLGSKVRTLEADLVEGGVVTKKPTTPEDTRTQDRGHQHTIQQTNHCTPLFLALALACERLQTWHAVAMQCGVGLLVSTSRRQPRCS